MLSDEDIRKMTGKELEELGYKLQPAVKHYNKQEEEQKDKANHD
jgi:hypothetical protein